MRLAQYRLYQFFLAVKAYLPAWAGGLAGKLSAQDRVLVESVLTTPAQQQLFNRMSPNDQRHAVAVARTIRHAGHRDTALLQAALLHDVAKSLGQPLIHRVMIVLFEVFWPAALSRLSSDQRQLSTLPRWRRPFFIHAHHPAIGATWASEAGCDRLTAELIRKHQDPLTSKTDEFNRLMAILKWADNLN